MCLVEANEKFGPAMCLVAFQGRSLYYNIQRYKLVRMRVSVTTKVCGPIVGTFPAPETILAIGFDLGIVFYG